MENEFIKLNFREKTQFGIENILVMRLDAIGDFILTSGFIRELRLNYPAAHITLVVSELVYPLAELCPYVNEVLPFNTKYDLNDFSVILQRISDLADEYLWRRHFSMSFCVEYMSYKFPTLLMLYISGARERIGYGLNVSNIYLSDFNEQDELNDLFLTKPIINPKDIISEAERNFYVLAAMNLSVKSNNIELWYNFRDFQNARRFLNNIDPQIQRIIVGIGAGGENRKYPVKQYIQTFKQIGAQSNVCFIIVGGKSEIEDAALLEKSLPTNNVLNLVNKTTLRETAAIIAQSDMYIGNDTGTMHMASALHKPVIAIYRQSKDKDETKLKGLVSEVDFFPPYQTISIILRPEHSFGDCQNVVCYGGCKEDFAHCITQVKPSEIVDAYHKLNYLINNSHNKSLNFNITRMNFI